MEHPITPPNNTRRTVFVVVIPRIMVTWRVLSTDLREQRHRRRRGVRIRRRDPEPVHRQNRLHRHRHRHHRRAASRDTERRRRRVQFPPQRFRTRRRLCRRSGTNDATVGAGTARTFVLAMGNAGIPFTTTQDCENMLALRDNPEPCFRGSSYPSRPATGNVFCHSGHELPGEVRCGKFRHQRARASTPTRTTGRNPVR